MPLYSPSITKNIIVTWPDNFVQTILLAGKFRENASLAGLSAAWTADQLLRISW